jgi:hypothetical protein
MNSIQPIIKERTKSIPIIKNLYNEINKNKPKCEYSLKTNIFDPSKSSPPNDFMIKLQMRMSLYNNNNNNNNNNNIFHDD